MNWQERDGAIWVEAAQLSALPSDVPYRVLLSPSMPGWKQRHDIEVFVRASANGTPIVLSSDCTHQGCPVEWKGDRYVCPCHGSAFAADGSVLNGPAKTPLKRPESFIAEEAVWVKVRDRA